MRYSAKREIISNILKSCSDHPSADIIFERARLLAPDISLSTVYNNLNLMAGNNEIITLETVDKKIHFDGNIKAHRHFICNECNKIIDLFFETEIPIELSALGLKVDDEKCVYYGTCKECLEKQKN